MSSFSSLKTAIANAIKANGNQEITGNLLQGILLSIVETLGDSAINTLETGLSNEANTRGNADTTLQTNINNEATARSNADTQLNNLITGIKNNIDNGYVYAGIATPSGSPVSGRVFYIAIQAGTYTNFGNLTIVQGINILKYNGSAWSQELVWEVDVEPVYESVNLVTSGGVVKRSMELTTMVLEKGYFNYSTSSFTSRNSYITLCYSIPCSEGEIYHYNGRAGAAASICSFKDINKNIISNYQLSNFEVKDIDITIPSGAYFVTFYSSVVINDDSQPFVFDVYKVVSPTINSYSLFNCKIYDHIGYLRSNGTFSSSTSYHCKYTEKIKCNEGDVFYYKGHGENLAVNYLFYNGNTIVSSGNNSSKYSEAEKIIIPSGVNGVVFSSYAVTNDDVVLEIFNHSLKKTFQESLVYNINGEDTVGYLNMESGTVTTDEDFHSMISERVKCSKGDVFYYVGKGFSTTASVCFYNSSGYTGQYLQIDNIDSDDFYKVIIPANVTSVEFASVAAAGVPITFSVFKLNDIINKIYKVQASKYILDSPLYRKSINWLGDSYIAGSSTGYLVSWHYMIAQKYEMIYRNYGLNGNTLVASTSQSVGPMSERYVNMDPDADYVMVVGGTNDYNHQCPISTFKTRLATFIENLVTMYPTAKIAFWTPWNAKGCTPLTIPLVDYAYAMEEVCEEYGMPCFNMYKNGGIFAWSTAVKTAFFQSDTDYAHLNADGHKFFMSKAEQLLTGL